MSKILPLLFSVTLSTAFAQTKTISGFTNESTEVQLKAEEKFDSYLQASNLDQWMKRLSARPHHLGSAYGKQNAEYMRDLFSVG